MGPAPTLVLAMALHRRGDRDEARRTLALAVFDFDWTAAVVSRAAPERTINLQETPSPRQGLRHGADGRDRLPPPHRRRAGAGQTPGKAVRLRRRRRRL